MTVPQGLQPIVVLPPTLPMIPLNSDIMMPGTALTKTMSAPLAGDCSFPEIDTSLSHAGSMPLYSTNMMYYPVEMENRLSPVSSSSDLSSASSFSDSSFSRGSSPCAGADSQRSTPRNWVDLLCAKNEKPKTSVKRLWKAYKSCLGTDLPRPECGVKLSYVARQKPQDPCVTSLVSSSLFKIPASNSQRSAVPSLLRKTAPPFKDFFST